MTMLRHTLIPLLLLLGLPVISNSQELGKFDDSLDQRPSIRCVIGTEKPDWTKESETVIHVQVKNTSSKPLELDVFPVLYLKVKQTNTPFTKEANAPFKRPYRAYSEYWAPADLKRDAPAPVDVGSKGSGVTITPKKQFLRMKPNSELEFAIHASNLKWADRKSSAWPSFLSLSRFLLVNTSSL